MSESRAPTQGGLAGIREVLRVAYRRKFIILVPAVLLSGIGWAMASKAVPLFTATAALTLDVSKVQIVDREVVSQLPLETSTLRSEIDVIRSRSLNDEVVVLLGLASDPGVAREVAAWHAWEPVFVSFTEKVLGRLFPGIFGQDRLMTPKPTASQIADWLIGNLNVTNDGRSLTILVSFTSENPARAAQIANTVARTYLDDQVLAKSRETMKASAWLGERVSEIRQDLEKSEAAVDDFRRQSGLIEVKGATIPAERLGDLNAQLSQARAERLRAEVNLQIAQQSGAQKLPDALASPRLQQLRNEFGQIHLQLTALNDHGAFYKMNDLKAQAAVLGTEMNAEMARIVAGLSTEVTAARQKEAELDQSFHAMEGQVGEVGHSNLQLIQLQREADANRAIYETFLSRYKQTLQQESLAVPDARLISQAVPPEEPIYPNKVRFLLLGTLGGLAIGGGFAFLRESFDRRIRHASAVETLTGIPVFGFVPKVSRWRGRQPQDYPVTDPQSQFSTALARIHAALRAPHSLDGKQVILITSAQPGDGKTSFCTSLARSLAKSRIRVLVIDADPYRAQVASAFGAPAVPAFGSINEQPIRLADIVQVDTKSAAHFTAAPNPDDLQFLVHSGKFEALVEAARAAYDIIIIDTPPVMTSADAALIGRFADTRLLMVRWGRTSADQMASAVGFLRLCRVGLDGIVMVGADAGSIPYGQLTSYYPPPSDQPSPRSLLSGRRTDLG
jgi:polysaccharide biosynthesis transport protein